MSRWYVVSVLDTHKLSPSMVENVYHLESTKVFFTKSEKVARRLGRSLAATHPGKEVHVMHTISFGTSQSTEPTVYTVTEKGEEFPE